MLGYFNLIIVYKWVYTLITYYSENVISFFTLFINILTITFTEDDFKTFSRVTFNFDILLFVKFFPLVVLMSGLWCAGGKCKPKSWPLRILLKEEAQIHQTGSVFVFVATLKKREIINNRNDFKRTKLPLLLAKDIPNSSPAIQDEQVPLVGN